MNYGPRIPLHFQQPEIRKSAGSPSFRGSRIHKVEYREMEDRPGISKDSVMRRHPSGELDYQWAKNMVVDAIHNASTEHALQPLQRAVLKMVMPQLDVDMLEAQANLMTKLSRSELTMLRKLVKQHMDEEANWNAGQGGGNVPSTRDGYP